ncbi:ATP-binding protein [Streptomyces sp. ODS05-4]|uniref:ATP-binding protein n=1 Tax=Streptomyces sp. ODS05-4 TaxID=2944939 RepID=UPI00210B846A|nr:ATP-binding protein [Streptomyces sp. ODS05-4]
MSSDPLWGDPLSEAADGVTVPFAGDLGDVTAARLAAAGFLGTLALGEPPVSAEHRDDILLAVSELAANAIQYAPGPFVLSLRRTFDGVHVVVADTNPNPPEPRRYHPSKGGGIGWHLIHALADEVSVVPGDDGKEIHLFLPW